jgi:hypothetical protein
MIYVFRYWKTLYNRFDSVVNLNENINDQLLMIKNHINDLNDYSRLLEKVEFKKFFI